MKTLPPPDTTEPAPHSCEEVVRQRYYKPTPDIDPEEV